jgi:hypothetical protein
MTGAQVVKPLGHGADAGVRQRKHAAGWLAGGV